MVLFLREAMRAIESLNCEEVMRAIASSMSPHVTPQQSPTPIFSATTADGITTVQTVSAAMTTLPTTPTRDGARVKGYCTDRAIFTLLRCTTDELFFSYCDSAVAHFKHAATRQPRGKSAVEACVRRHHREATAAGIDLGTTSRRRKPIVETCVDNTAKLRPQALVLAR
jgi:hypothetical protein